MLKFRGSSLLVTSSLIRPIRATYNILVQLVTRMPRVSGDFPVQLATRLPDWSAAVQCCPFVVSFSKFHERDAHDLLQTCYRHA